MKFVALLVGCWLESVLTASNARTMTGPLGLAKYLFSYYLAVYVICL